MPLVPIPIGRWLADHPTGSLAAAAQVLDLAITEVEGFCADLANAEMIERAALLGKCEKPDPVCAVRPDRAPQVRATVVARVPA